MDQDAAADENQNDTSDEQKFWAEFLTEFCADPAGKQAAKERDDRENNGGKHNWFACECEAEADSASIYARRECGEQEWDELEDIFGLDFFVFARIDDKFDADGEQDEEGDPGPETLDNALDEFAAEPADCGHDALCQAERERWNGCMAPFERLEFRTIDERDGACICGKRKARQHTGYECCDHLNSETGRRTAMTGRIIRLLIL